MKAEDIIQTIARSEKQTPVKVYLNLSEELSFPDCKVFGEGLSKVIFGNYKDIKPIVENNQHKIIDLEIESDRRNSGIPLLDTKGLNARIEPGALIRDKVEIADNVVIMMGAVVNIGSVIGKGTMIDMNAVLGGRAIVGENCHIGAGAVLAGVIEPASAQPVVIEDEVYVGANSVVIEGVRIGKGSVVAAGSVVTKDVPENSVVGGTPARLLKKKDKKTTDKTELVEALRKL
ncbi:2,3,4,5-tetrahydropyridine-2,6-dicarboxylate N-acetyltransferase [Alkalibacterium iburiense]|uniref:2,3,4,5-tetrahydropyridine-2,6-dicarboxylate N-acetyltransferase n=1 Tax=Alkalibacterium iburiense TaxID=290589 RepID=A0ABP3HF34_9LACT